MRRQRLAACGLALAGALVLAAPASSEDWTDAQGRLMFSIPARGGWATEGAARELRGPDGQSAGVSITVSNANDRCHFQSQARGGAEASVANIRRAYGAALPDTYWAEIGPLAANLVGLDQPTPATFQGAAVDTSGFWPINRATYAVGDYTVHVTVQGRPDRELRSYCHTWEPGAEPNTAAYDAFVASIATPRDAEWRARFEAEQAAAAPQPEAQ
ncbi:MAG: hypothetical protein HXY28_14760 [Hydrogenophilaceae bacterium]|nr:hypothetical protein [Hydrogenophilaceae bacterium]